MMLPTTEMQKAGRWSRFQVQYGEYQTFSLEHVAFEMSYILPEERMVFHCNVNVSISLILAIVFNQFHLFEESFFRALHFSVLI